MNAIPESHYVTIDVTRLKGIIQVYENRWWWCVDGLPEKAIFYRGANSRRYPGSPQCNGDWRISERIVPPHSGAQLVFIERAFVPWEDKHG